MADTEAAAWPERPSEGIGLDELSTEQISYQSTPDLQPLETERIFNLTGTAKLSSEHIAKLQRELPNSPSSQDQIASWSPGSTSSGQSLHVCPPFANCSVSLQLIVL